MDNTKRRIINVPVSTRERITETVHVNGKVYLNTVDAKGRPRTREVTRHVQGGARHG